MTSTGEEEDGKVPGLLEVLALVPDPRKRRGRRFRLVFILAVAVACALAGARNFREAGDHAADLPQDVLARLGGRPHPLLRRITAPGGTRIRTLVHAIGADLLDEVIGGWLRDLAQAGRLNAAHACRETAQYIAGKKEDGSRESHYCPVVEGNRAGLQRAAFGAIQEQGPRDPDHTELDRSHGRVTRRSIWVTDAAGTGFPHASQVARIRRDATTATAS